MCVRHLAFFLWTFSLLGLQELRSSSLPRFSPPRRLGAATEVGREFSISAIDGPGQTLLIFAKSARIHAASSREGFWSLLDLKETEGARVQFLIAESSADEKGITALWQEEQEGEPPQVWVLKSPDTRQFSVSLLQDNAFRPLFVGPGSETFAWHTEEQNSVYFYKQKLGEPAQRIGEGVVLAGSQKAQQTLFLILRNGKILLVLEKREGEYQELPLFPAQTSTLRGRILQGPEGNFVLGVSLDNFLFLFQVSEDPFSVRELGTLATTDGSPIKSFDIITFNGEIFVFVFSNNYLEYYTVTGAVNDFGLRGPQRLLELADPVEDAHIILDKEGFFHVVLKSGGVLWYSTSCPPPEADFSLTPAQGDPPLRVEFRDLSKGVVNSVLWDFGDGKQSSEFDPVHVYEEPGAYTVTLTAKGPGGSSSKRLERAVLVHTQGTWLRLPTIKVSPSETHKVWHPLIAQFPEPILGFQIALLVPKNAISEGPEVSFEYTAIKALNPEFVAVNINDSGEDLALVVGVIFDWSPPFDGRVLEPDQTNGETTLFYLIYRPNTKMSGSVRFPFTNSFGDPPIRNVFTSIQRESLVPFLEDGGYKVSEGLEVAFLRGDPNADGSLDLADAIFLLSFLFAGGPPPMPCLDAGDVNDSGDLDLADPISLLSFLFASGSPPPYPFPSKGLDPTEDRLGCGKAAISQQD